MIPLVIPGTTAAFTNILIKVGIIVALVGAAYVKGCSDEKERFDDYKVMVKAVGEAQEARTKTWIAQGKQTKEKADADYERVVHGLLTNLDDSERRLRAELARGRIVPAAGPASQGGDGKTVCFNADVLDQGLRASMDRFLERNKAVLGKGEGAAGAFHSCAAWAVENASRSNR